MDITKSASGNGLTFEDEMGDSVNFARRDSGLFSMRSSPAVMVFDANDALELAKFLLKDSGYRVIASEVVTAYVPDDVVEDKPSDVVAELVQESGSTVAALAKQTSQEEVQEKLATPYKAADSLWKLQPHERTRGHYAEAYAQALTEKFKGEHRFEVVSVGAKYAKIAVASIKFHPDAQATSVHCFVDDNGRVYKPAGWKAPAKGVRCNISNETSFDLTVKAASWSGGYLYR